MILETLFILFIWGLISNSNKNKKEALTYLDSTPYALSILTHMHKEYGYRVNDSVSSKKLADDTKKYLVDVENHLEYLAEKKLVKKINTQSEVCPVKYGITPLGRTIVSEKIRKERQKSKIQNKEKIQVNKKQVKKNTDIFSRIEETKTETELPKKNQNLIKNKFEKDVPINFYSKPKTDENLSFEIGEAFENFVAEELFPDHHFVLTHMTPNFAVNSKRYCESSLKPDLGFRDKKTGKEFYVECKFRGSLTEDGKYDWTKDKNQANRYRNIQKDENKQVFVAMGLGGMSNNPRNIFLVPIDEIKYLEIYPSVLRNWEVSNKYDVFKIVNS
ncbi:hypothetical protein MmarC5_0945 [Methanococcus maripaludis C5]|uniref:Uncharacterized protein n=1 Tax=Methanococcus maripaludis (strain C5 / ATCC BAA-1333) TaxID=402880 RepID=A4FYG7_METM5|nr:hypothetical protein [Methanococcus maripaludis]ABO35251.1 hypothetical protein MmarC5_0945 [Methanococcus maripaludis C5]